MRQPDALVTRNPSTMSIRAAQAHSVADFQQLLAINRGRGRIVGEYPSYSTHTVSDSSLQPGKEI